MRGTIRRVVMDRGFGFIRVPEGTEFFFHRSEVQYPSSFDLLREGDAVTFEVEDSPKGPRAKEVARA